MRRTVLLPYCNRGKYCRHPVICNVFYILQNNRCPVFTTTNIIHSMEQNPPSESIRFSASQEIPLFHGTRKFVTTFTSMTTNNNNNNNRTTNQMYVKHINSFYFVWSATCFDPYRVIIRPSSWNKSLKHCVRYWDPNNVRSVLMTWLNWKAWWWSYKGRNM